MGKNIIILSDGTGQIGGKNNNTNIYKLFNMAEDRTDRQVVFYDPGLGTNWRRITGNIFGNGFSKNILDCYRFLFKNYQAGDKVYLFGFSRGAATVRSLTGFIHLFGILPQSREDLIQAAYKIYMITDRDKRIKAAEAFIGKNHTMWCKIEFIGVFDTVAALGFPFKGFSFIFDKLFPHKFHSFDLSDSVLYARHALSIDEERKTFLPVLWNKLSEEQPKERLKQVWFCGVHTDVGGGYELEELSNISLNWMLNEAIEKGLIIYKDSLAYKHLSISELDKVNGHMHNEQTGFIGGLFRRQVRSWNLDINGQLCIHETVLKRTKNKMNTDDPNYKSWIHSFSDITIIK